MKVKPHSPEPWLTFRDNLFEVVLPLSGPASLQAIWSKGTGADTAFCPDTDADGGNANARRIVACINACAGIPTERLETLAGQLQRLIGRAEEVGE